MVLFRTGLLSGYVLEEGITYWGTVVRHGWRWRTRAEIELMNVACDRNGIR